MTTKAKHTPGPWQVVNSTPQRPSRALVCAEGVDIYNAPLCVETAANARLIAAAPDLHNACEEAYNYLIAAETDTYCSYCDTHAPKDPDTGRVLGRVKHQDGCLIAIIEAALAKAEGGAA